MSGIFESTNFFIDRVLFYPKDLLKQVSKNILHFLLGLDWQIQAILRRWICQSNVSNTRLKTFLKLAYKQVSEIFCMFLLGLDWQIQTIIAVGFANPTGAIRLKTFLKLA